VHNYTGICPANVLEISPSSGSCIAGCQYCLVTDGTHLRNIHVYTNYPEKVARSLERNKDRNLFYYFSPKTEAFSETHLFNGLAHNILKTFIAHYEKYPDSGVRLFIATKAGMQHLKVKHDGTTVFDLLKELVSKVQINGSIGIMPSCLRNILEPNVAGIKERLEVLQECRNAGIWAESVLCQPLLIPYLKEDVIRDYMKQLSNAGVKNIKPEFFTAEIRNLVLVAQYIHYYDPGMTGEFFHAYLMESNQKHIKQRSRLAPEKKICAEKLSLIRDIADEYNISISLCNWVKKELNDEAPFIREIDKKSLAHGYRCLGYQTRLFNTSNEQ
jgi:DNA repair photolyase